jgi:hypothetical protein
MIDDAALSRKLTAAIRATEGVAGVYPAQPIVEAAARAIAVKLALRMPDILVDIDRADEFTTFSAHIATLAAFPAPDTVRRVGELIRAIVSTDFDGIGDVAIDVKVRLIEDGDGPAS